MKILTLDGETYFDKTYSLRSLNTEEYVRTTALHADGKPLFKVHMCGVRLPSGASRMVNLEHDLDLRELIKTSAVLAHHAAFDGLILEHHYGLRPALWLDTLSMARLVLPKLRSHSLDSLAAHYGLAAKTVPYDLFRGVRDLPPETYRQLSVGCLHDVSLTHSIALKLLPLVPAAELKIIDSTVRMFVQPVLHLDRPRMEAFLKAEKIRKAKAMIQAGAVMGGRGIENVLSLEPMQIREYLEWVETELQSSNKFRMALEALGHACPMKWSDKATAACFECGGCGDENGTGSCNNCSNTGKVKGGYIPALAKNDTGMKELLEHEDSRVQALAAARLGVKSTIDETRAERLLASDARGSLPVYLSYAAAKTLRFGGGDKTNWQNFRRGGEIRKSILAPEGHKLVIGDLSQIEYRLLCWLTGQTDKLDALASGRDLYSETASRFYEREVTKDDKPSRGLGKLITLSCGYGSGADSIKATARNGTYGPPLDLSDVDSLKARDLYRSGHPCVTTFWKWCDHALSVLANGRETTYQGGHKAPSPCVFAIRDHKIHLPNGTSLDYTGLRWARNCDVYPDQADDDEGYAWWEPSRKGYTRTWGSHVTADVVQALACAVIKDVWVRMLARHGRPCLQVHDELVFSVKSEDAERVAHGLETEMKTPPAWCADIPLECEIIVSDRYEK